VGLLPNSGLWLLTRNFGFLPCGTLHRAANNTAADFARKSDPKEGEGKTENIKKHAQDESPHVFHNLSLEVAYDHFHHTYQRWYNVRGLYTRVFKNQEVEVIRGPSS